VSGRPAGEFALFTHGFRLPFQFDLTTLAEDGEVPDLKGVFAVPVANGFLIGTDVGEWGGAVWWFSADGKHSRRLLAHNCQAILTDQNVAICFCGLAHLSIAEGSVHAFEIDAAHAWVRVGNVMLPGTPTDLRLAEDGSVTMECLQQNGERVAVRYAGGTLSYRL
jgi:hypothetical protein